MPDGYLVSLGDNNIDVGDGIGGGLVTFTTERNLGAGEWIWSGTSSGSTFTNVVEPSVYFLATDGNVYFVPDFGPVDTITTASVNQVPVDYEVLTAAENADTIFSDLFDNEIYGQAGDDTITDDAGQDTVFAGAGDDTVSTDAEADTIYGDSDVVGAASSEAPNWSAKGGDGTDLSNFTQTSGDVEISVDFDLGFNNMTDVSTDAQFVDAGEPMSTTSALQLGGAGTGVNATTTFSFEGVAGTGISSEVENVVFRLNDVDAGAWTDVLIVNAFDANRNAVSVTLTASGNDTVSGQTVTAGAGNDSANQANGSVLVEIVGPVQFIEIIYENTGTDNQFLWVTDVHYDTMPFVEGNDTIDGGSNADVIDAGDGDDSITFAEGDTVTGGEGDDLFILDDLGETSNGTITIIGGETRETSGDTLRLGDLADLSTLNITNSDDAAGGLSGSVTLDEGTILNFSEIKYIICFTAGTNILTPRGERKIETPKICDPVLTRDHGIQRFRRIGQRTVPAFGRFAPISIAKNVLGARRELLVSPQHRMLFTGYQSELFFGSSETLISAKHVVDDTDIQIREGGMVTYIHTMFDEHEIIFAEGASSESVHPDGVGLDAIADEAREELFLLFPELRSTPNSYGDTARKYLKKHEALLLAA